MLFAFHFRNAVWEISWHSFFLQGIIKDIINKACLRYPRPGTAMAQPNGQTSTNQNRFFLLQLYFTPLTLKVSLLHQRLRKRL
jgi:hypothetical protein